MIKVVFLIIVLISTPGYGQNAQNDIWYDFSFNLNLVKVNAGSGLMSGVYALVNDLPQESNSRNKPKICVVVIDKSNFDSIRNSGKINKNIAGPGACYDRCTCLEMTKSTVSGSTPQGLSMKVSYVNRSKLTHYVLYAIDYRVTSMADSELIKYGLNPRESTLWTIGKL